MNQVFRVILRCSNPDTFTNHGTMLKKRVYSSKEDFDRYSKETIERYREQGFVDIEERTGSKWILIMRHEHKCWKYCKLLSNCIGNKKDPN